MKHRRLGRSGLVVSEVGLGTWLTAGVGVDDDAVIACVARAAELGVNFFDTADVYAGGEAERILGRALARVPRARVVVASKCFYPMGDGPNERGLSRKHISEAIEASLERLGLRYLDLYQCHRFDPDVPLLETVATMTDLVRRGRIHYWGVSEWTAVQMAEAVALARQHNLEAPIANQPMYNALARRIEIDVLDTCDRLGMGVVAYSPLAQGVLTGKYARAADKPAGSRAAHPKAGELLRSRLRDTVLERVAALSPIAADAGLSMAQLAIAFCLRDTRVSSVLVGVSRPEQLDDNVAASGAKLSAETLARIDAALGTAPVDQYTGKLVGTQRT